MKSKSILFLSILLVSLLTVLVQIPTIKATSSTVGTSTTNYAIFAPTQRKTFYANGRFWVFFLKDGYNIVYSTSVDGVTWTTPTNLRPTNPAYTYGYEFSVWFDGTYLHYAYTPYLANTPLYYRRGIPNANGTITWSADEQLAVPGVSQIYYDYPFVSVDSYGYPYIAYARYNCARASIATKSMS